MEVAESKEKLLSDMVLIYILNKWAWECSFLHILAMLQKLKVFSLLKILNMDRPKILFLIFFNFFLILIFLKFHVDSEILW